MLFPQRIAPHSMGVELDGLMQFGSIFVMNKTVHSPSMPVSRVIIAGCKVMSLLNMCLVKEENLPWYSMGSRGTARQMADSGAPWTRA